MEMVCFFLPIKAVDNFSAKNEYTNHNGCNLNWLQPFLLHFLPVPRGTDCCVKDGTFLTAPFLGFPSGRERLEITRSGSPARGAGSALAETEGFRLFIPKSLR